MAESTLSLAGRIALAFRTFIAVLADADFAAAVQRLRTGAREPAPAGTSKPAAPPAMKATPPDAALQLLAILQREARLVDFVQEDLATYRDADIGAAARIVHEGCRKALREHFTFSPVRSENEGSRVTLDPGFDAAAVHLTGNVVGKPPFHGQLTHRGWKVVDVRLPTVSGSHDPRVVAPAEVEL